MPGDLFTVRFVPDGRVCQSTGPIDLYLAAAAAGILVEQPCGGQATCGRCRVRVIEGAAAPGEADREQLTPSELALGWRLGCQLTITADASIEIPPVVRSLAGKSFGDALPAASLDGPDAASRTLSPEDEELLPASLARGRPRLGLAIDIGTTSLAVGLIDLGDGGVVASASCLNPQVALGADVIARIKHSMDHADGTERLAQAVRDGLADLVGQLLGDAGCDGQDVVTAAVAGNPTMIQAWAGVPVAGLGTAPYAAAWSSEQHWRAADVGLPVHPGGSVYVFPMVRSHVGGDAVAAAVASGFDLGRASRLLIDLGTNCEVMVASGERVVATSAAAGPAFEGVSIRCGMRAAPGAIDVVSLHPSGEVRFHTVGGLRAAGLCGSALIDLVAELLRVGVLARSGYLRKAHELPADGRPFAPRLAEVDGQTAFCVASAGEGASREIVLTARDVRELQLAKGSTLAAITLACGSLGIDPLDLQEVLVAGAFGNFLRKASVARMRLVPAVAAERVRFVGNAAGVGARLALLDSRVRARARAFARRAEYLDLATHRDYQDTFMNTLAF